MPPLTEEFIEGLKLDFKENPIDVERSHSTATDNKTSSQEKHWRNWQHRIDKSCMEWTVPMDFVDCLERVVRNGPKFPKYPVYVKGTSWQQMGILLTVWYADPDLLLRYYDLLQSCIRNAKKGKRVGNHLNMVSDNLGQILSVLNFADDDHVEGGTEEVIATILEEARSELGERYQGVIHNWPMDPYGEMVNTLRVRVSEFIGEFAYNSGADESTEKSLPKTEPDLDAFIREMWKQDPVTTLEYAEALQRCMVGGELRKLPVSPEEREWLCICEQTMAGGLHAINSSALSPAEKVMLRNYREQFPLDLADSSNVANTDSRLVSKNELRGPNAVLRWEDDFSIVWRDGVEFCLFSKKKRMNNMRRAIKCLVEEYSKGCVAILFSELKEIINSPSASFQDMFKGYEVESQALLTYGLDGAQKVGLNI